MISSSLRPICGLILRMARHCIQRRAIRRFCAGGKVSWNASKATACCLESSRIPTFPFVTYRSTLATAAPENDNGDSLAAGSLFTALYRIGIYFGLIGAPKQVTTQSKPNVVRLLARLQ